MRVTPRARHAIPLLVLAGAVALFFAFRLDRFLSFERLVTSRASLRATVEAWGVGALAVYAATYVTVAALSVPGGFILTLTGGFLFGAALGGAAAAMSASLGATIVFLAARTVLNDFLARKAGGIVGRIREGFRRSAWSFMLSLRLSPIVPFWLVNIGAALAGVPLKTFVWTTALGILPVTFTVAFAGANLDRIAAASAATLDACRAAGGADCRAGLPVAEIVSPAMAALLLSASAVALLPAVVRSWRARRTGAKTEPETDVRHPDA